MRKREIRRDDGRYLIYYSFEDEGIVDSPDAASRPNAGESIGTDAPDENVENQEKTSEALPQTETPKNLKTI